MMTALLSGCGNSGQKDVSDGSTNTVTDDGNEGDSTVENGEQVTIRFMDNMASEVRDRAYAEIIANFEEANPNIKIEYETVPWDQSHSKLVTLGSTGTMCTF